MRARAEIIDLDKGLGDLIKRIRSGADHVDIGIHSDEGEELVKIAAAHEFGATINHPGGTKYGYATAADAKEKHVSFLKGGAGYRVLGETPAHVIKIPMRSFIRSTVDSNKEEYARLAASLIKRILLGKMDKFMALSVMGQKIEADIKRTIVTMKHPPLAPATIRAKGSSSLLQDTGHLKNSIRYVVKDSDGADNAVQQALAASFAGRI